MMIMRSSSGEYSGSSSEDITRGGREFEIARVLASLGNHNNNNNNTSAASAAVAAEVYEEEEEGIESGGSGVSGGGECGEGQSCNNNNSSWGSKGKRWISSSSNSKRVKEFSSFQQQQQQQQLRSSSPSHSHSHSHSHSPFPFDLNLDQPNVSQEEFSMDVEVKVEEVCESASAGHVRNPPYNGERSRHNMTEAEKEARRIRRVLANRESARQTIRRRQAFHEELTRKAAVLASENETLKRSKELAVKELQSLHATNKNLKGQLSQTLGFNLGENKTEAESSSTDTQNLHSMNWPQFMYKKVSADSLVFPACVPPSDLNVSQLSHQLYNPCMFSEQEKSQSKDGQNMPWCILPCPVLLPVPNIKSHQLPSFLWKDNDEGRPVDSKFVHSPSSVIHCQQNCPLGMPEDQKTGSHPSTQQDSCRNQSPFGLSQLSCCSRGGFAHERNSCITPHHLLKPEFHTTSRVLPENRKERTLKEKENIVAGAEARRKRKELMKLKSHLHSHLLGRENG